MILFPNVYYAIHWWNDNAKNRAVCVLIDNSDIGLPNQRRIIHRTQCGWICDIVRTR